MVERDLFFVMTVTHNNWVNNWLIFMKRGINFMLLEVSPTLILPGYLQSVYQHGRHARNRRRLI
jgi:hypothetical protein